MLRLVHGNDIKNVHILTSEVLNITVDTITTLDDVLGTVAPDADNVCKAIAERVWQSGIVLTTPRSLAKITAQGDTKEDIKKAKQSINTKKKDRRLETRLLRHHPDIGLYSYKGKTNAYKPKTGEFFAVKGGVTNERLLGIVPNLKSVTGIKRIIT